jgi:hypothetical protein
VRRKKYLENKNDVEGMDVSNMATYASSNDALIDKLISKIKRRTWGVYKHIESQLRGISRTVFRQRRSQSR